MRILGVSSHHRDAAACLIEDGVLIAAAEERPLVGRGGDAHFPLRAMRFCLAAAGADGGRVDAVAYHERPLGRLHRLLESHLSAAPRGLRRFVRAMPEWMQERVWIEGRISDALEACDVENAGPVHFVEHHLSHLSSAFYASPFDAAAVVVLDGLGEWATTSIATGRGPAIEVLHQLEYPHSLGTLCAAFAQTAGFHPRAQDKFVGLAAYGEPRFAKQIFDEVLDVKPDGSFRLAAECFGTLEGDAAAQAHFETRFGVRRKAEFPISQREADLAASLQVVVEEIALRIVRHARDVTGLDRLCLGGELAANCKLNARLLREAPFRDLWIQPVAGDGGSAIGAALAVWYGALGQDRHADASDSMRGCLLGPEFAASEIRTFLDSHAIPYRELAETEWAPVLARLLTEEKIVGVFQGRLEFGPHALGNRSIFADPRSPRLAAHLNANVKVREGFRPIAAACLAERVADWFELESPAPYMPYAVPLRSDRRIPIGTTLGDDFDLEKAGTYVRSAIPAVTHVDYTSRVQSVGAESPRLQELLRAFESQTGCPILATTGLRIRGEPLAATPRDAVHCFRHGDMDALVLGPFLLDRLEQNATVDSDWSRVLLLD